MKTLANFKFELNRDGVKELLQSEEMQKVLAKKADEVLRRLPSYGNGYGKTSGMTSERAKVTVGTRTNRAARENLKNNTLLKALGGGRG